MNKARINQHGFTIIEMVVVVTIMLIMIYLSSIGFRKYRRRQLVLAAVGEYQSLMDKARSNANSGKLSTCNKLVAYRFQTQVVSGKVVISVLPVCESNIETALVTQELDERISISPSAKTIDYRVLYKGAGNYDTSTQTFSDFSSYDVTFTYDLHPATQFQFEVEEGGFAAHGDFL